MGRAVSIGVIGDYDGRPSHLATDEALHHCAAALGLELDSQWLPTESLERDGGEGVLPFHGLWCAPGSPFRSMRGALAGIRRARERDIPFLGTCGGFQHAVIEFAQNALGIQNAAHAEIEPNGANLFIMALACSLVGQIRTIQIKQGTLSHQCYKQREAMESFLCSYGLNPDYQRLLEENGFITAAIDENGETRILELPQNRFHVATLFVPQLSSTIDKPHRLILAFLSNACQ